MNKVYTNNKFKGFYPVGTAAVVVASSLEMACLYLNKELEEMGLPADAKEEDMNEVDMSYGDVIILNDGDY